MENYIKKYSDTNGENEVDDLMKSTFFGHDQIDQETGELNEEGKFWLSGLAGKSAMNGGAQDDSTDQVQQFMDENSEFQKLGSLNMLLNKDEIVQPNKILLIYHQILEELHEGCNRN